VLVLEDSPSGVRAGAAAGMPVVGLTCGGQPASELLQAGATLVAHDFTELLAIIKEQLQEQQQRRSGSELQQQPEL
jgi:beta-phosphoglucomutase-like phosphatase (HAD superfamily)